MESYNTSEWNEKRNEILKRDNFTCKSCKTFNPQEGVVEIYNSENGYLELHEYLSTGGDSKYTISSSGTGVTLEMDFGLDWLVLPVLQVHHKRYIENKKVWDYADDDLETLCKACHTDTHVKNEIPVYNADGSFKYSKKFEPIDFSSGHNHNYEPWVFINRDSKNHEYKLTGVKPVLHYIAFGDENNNPKFHEEVENMMKIFFKKYLPKYKQ